MNENHSLKLQALVYTPTHKTHPQTGLIHGEHVLKLQNQRVQVLKIRFKLIRLNKMICSLKKKHKNIQ